MISLPFPPSELYIWRILLIDDDEDDYVLVRDMLAEVRAGKFTLEWHATCEAGRQTLQTDRGFDVVIVDYDIGCHTGIELIRAAVAARYPAPFLLLTGRGTYEVDLAAMQAGAADYLSKGEINPVFLERAIRYAIERMKNETMLREREAQLHASEAALRESEARERARANELEMLMDAVPAMIWISHDTQGEEVIGNRFGNEFLGMRQGTNISENAPPDARQALPYRSFRNGKEIPPDELPIQVASATGLPARDYDFEMVFDDGSTYQLIGNVNPIYDPDGCACGAVGAFIDITRLRRLEAEQIEARAQMEIQRRLMEQREQERQAIARDIHDGPIQTLSSMAFHLQMIKEVFAGPELEIELNQVAMDVRNSVQELRTVINELRPPTLMHFGLSRVIRMHTADMHDQHPEIEFYLDVVEDAKILSDQACLSLFRIYQAGINNILKHSGATQVWVSYHLTPSTFTFELRDNGIGFEPSKDFDSLTRNGHFGLVGMKERAESIGGEFSLSSQPGKGTLIIIQGPLLGKNLK